MRTSRILASLMAASQAAKDNSRAAPLVINLSPAVDTMVKAAAGALQSERMPGVFVLDCHRVCASVAHVDVWLRASVAC